MNEIIYKKIETEEEIQGAYEVSKNKENIDWLGGGVIPPILRQSAVKGELIIAKDNDLVVGFIHFHKRRDGYHVIYHICVLPEYKGNHIAYNMSMKVPFPHELKCKPGNEKIQGLCKKLGMHFVCEKKYKNKKGTEIRIFIYRHDYGLFNNT